LIFQIANYSFAAVMTIIIILTGIKYGIDTIQNRSRLNSILFYMFFAFALVLIFDITRLMVFMTPLGPNPTLGTYFFIIKVFLTLLGYPFAFKLHVIILKYMGKEKKIHLIIRFYVISLGVILSVITIFTIYSSSPNFFGYYVYQVNPLIGMIMILLYFPLNLWIIIENRKIVKEINDPNTKFKINILTFLVFFMVGERMSSLMAYGLLIEYAYIHFDIILLIHSLVILGEILLFIIILFKYNDFVEKIGMHFAIKSMFIIKNSGQLLFEHDFEENVSKDAHSSENLLVGGFIYAITEGFKEMLKIKDLSSFTTGERSVVIKHGKHVFGVLIASESSYLLQNKLGEFLVNYEDKYKDILENWTGEITILKKSITQDLLFDIFR